jgi:hypothetical protein
MRRLLLIACTSLFVVGPASAGVGCECLPPGGDDPSWSGNDTIVYTDTGSRDVYIRRLDGRATRLTHEEQIHEPDPIRRWAQASPDGTLVAYRSDRGLAVVAVPGGAARTLDPQAAFDAIAFSPDGTQIAYVAGKGLRTIAVDGSGRRDVVPAGEAPDWSPDGSSLAYAAGSSIFVVAPDGSGRRMLTAGGTPRWSPAGSALAYERDEGVWVVSRSGADPRRLASGWDPRWLPDGRTIEYIGPGWSIRLVDSSGGLSRVLLETAQQERSAVPSPDGRHVAYVVDNARSESQTITHGNVTDVYVAASDGTARSELTGTCAIGPTTDPRALCLNTGAQALPANIVAQVEIHVTRVKPGSLTDRGRSAILRGYLTDGLGHRVFGGAVNTDGRAVEFYPSGTRNDGFWSLRLIPQFGRPFRGRVFVTIAATEAAGTAHLRISFPASLVR